MKYLVALFLAAGLPAPDGGNQVTVSTGVSTAVWSTLPDCVADGGNALNYTQSSKAFACGAVKAERVVCSSVTKVGNAGAGEDNLITCALPAALLATDTQVIRLTASGDAANNANAKTVKCYFGATAVISHALATNLAQDWKVVADVWRSSATAQKAAATLTRTSTGPDAVVVDYTTPAETLSGAITVKCTGTATTDDDIQQQTLLVEFLGP